MTVPCASSRLRAAALAPLAALALLAAGCGGEDGDGGETPPGGAQPRSEAAPQTGGGGAGGEPRRREGAGSERPGGRGGEASIEDFGSEASGGDREAIESAFRTYMTALAEEDYATACSLLSQQAKAGIARFAQPESGRRGCAAFLPALLAPTAKTIAREQAGGEITKVRVEGDEAFVVFRAPGAKLYQLPMVREEGQWKSGLLAASVLVPDL